MKKFFAIILSLVFITCFSCVTAYAATQASDYLLAYEATLFTGRNRNELQIQFDTYALDSMSSLGISQIKVYKDNGSYVKTITGTKTNGLLSSGYGYSGAYTIKATAGEHYYLELTFIARDSSGSDYKTYTTNTAMAAA